MADSLSRIGMLLPRRLMAWLGAALLLPSFPVFAAEADQGAAQQLAAHIAHAAFSDDRSAKLALMTEYEAVYGSIDTVPTRWPALVRRTLVCQQLANRVCVRSSLEALKSQGGLDGLQLNHLFEVSRYGMTTSSIRSRLLDAAEDASSRPAEPTVTPSVPVETKKSVEAAAAAPAPAASVVPDRVPAWSTASSASADAQPAAAPVEQTAPAPAAKKPRSLVERATTRLQRMSSDEQSGFFLDALFCAIAACLLLLLALFVAMRGRRSERKRRQQAVQEALRLEALRAEEKIKADHELWSEQLKSEVAIEAQKAHADEVLRTVRSAADEALAAELLRFQMDQEEASIAFSNELHRLQDALRTEQAKTENVAKAAKSRADQAIDAYDQMAARELVYAHKQNDDLQDTLKAEAEVRKTLEAKVADALQLVEAYKQRESRLNEVIALEQRARTGEVRNAAEKLKAAQQVAVALQTSLSALRAQHAELQQRVEEAGTAADQGAASESQSGTEQAPPGVQRTL